MAAKGRIDKQHYSAETEAKWSHAWKEIGVTTDACWKQLLQCIQLLRITPE